MRSYRLVRVERVSCVRLPLLLSRPRRQQHARRGSKNERVAEQNGMTALSTEGQQARSELELELT